MLYPMSEVTHILAAVERGDPHAAADLLPLVYDELRKLAAARLAEEKPGQTLQGTALVHEAYLRLVGADSGQSWDGRGHFFAAAAEAMRRILVDAARRKRSLKRGGDLARQDLDAVDIAVSGWSEDPVALGDTLTRLAGADKAAAGLAHPRFYADLPPTRRRASWASPRTADRLWADARAWLHRGRPDDPGHVPQLHVRICPPPARDGQDLPVGTERQRSNRIEWRGSSRAGVRLEGAAFPARGHVPELHRPILIA
jgi:RNA polymerase sigma factor (TIGR02999 family)